VAHPTKILVGGPSCGVPHVMLLSVVMQLPITGDSLSNQPWYFGSMDRDESEQKLARFRGTVYKLSITSHKYSPPL